MKRIMLFAAIAMAIGCNNNSETTGSQQDTASSNVTAEFIVEEAPDESNDTDGAAIAVGDTAISSKMVTVNVNRDQCSDVLQTLYQKLDVMTDKEYLERLVKIYNSTSQGQVNENKKSMFGIDVPDYGSLQFGSNKGKVKSVSSQYEGKTDFTLKTHERFALSTTYIRSADVLSAHKAWSECMHRTNPEMICDRNSDTEVLTSFEMLPTNSGASNAKVVSIVFSDNLQLIRGDIKAGSRIPYRGKYSFTFKRSDKGPAFVGVNLDRGESVIPADIPSLEKPPCEVKTKTDDFIATAQFDISANWIKINAPGMKEQKVTFKDQRKNPYSLKITVNTNLNNKDAKITSFYYEDISGGFSDFKWNKKTEVDANGRLSVSCTMKSGQKKMKGKFIIRYTIDSLYCPPTPK